MPIGKSSITKRVAKQPAENMVTEKVTPPTTEKNIAPELVATTAAAPAKKAPAKKSATAATKATATKSTAAKSTAAKTATKTASATATTAAKKPAASKTTAPKATAPKTEKKPVETAVLANVAPETVEAVIGHKENAKVEKVQIGQKMPSYLL